MVKTKKGLSLVFFLFQMKIYILLKNHRNSNGRLKMFLKICPENSYIIPVNICYNISVRCNYVWERYIVFVMCFHMSVTKVYTCSSSYILSDNSSKLYTLAYYHIMSRVSLHKIDLTFAI